MTTTSEVLNQAQITAIATNAYNYGYPLLLMHFTKLVRTNVYRPDRAGHAPINQVGRVRTFPDASFTDVVKPNVDTFYTMAWMDLKAEPLVLNIPDTMTNKGPRYYLMPMLDAYSNVFVSPGTRTTGSGAQQYIIKGPKWEGDTPAGIEVYQSPTNMVWMLGRIQVNGKKDGVEVVWPMQNGFTLTPLSQLNNPNYTPPHGERKLVYDKMKPVNAVSSLSYTNFINLMLELMKDNPPNMEYDKEILAEMRLIGIEQGKPFSMEDFDQATQDALNTIPLTIIDQWNTEMPKKLAKEGALQNGWMDILKNIGVFGNDYLQRAFIAYKGLGANIIEDAIYPNTVFDRHRQPLVGGVNYKMTFAKGQLPPVEAFWSITAYNSDNLLVANELNRYALGDRSNLQRNKNDESTTIYIQPNSPGAELESNWLPSPASGKMSLTLRLYWPKRRALNYTWIPPFVDRNE